MPVKQRALVGDPIEERYKCHLDDNPSGQYPQEGDQAGYQPLHRSLKHPVTMQHGQGVVLAVLHGGGGQLLGLVVRDLPPRPCASHVLTGGQSVQAQARHGQGAKTRPEQDH